MNCQITPFSGDIRKQTVVRVLMISVPLIPPVKWLSIHFTLTEKLNICVGILEKGGLSQAEYDELQQCIFKDIRDTK